VEWIAEVDELWKCPNGEGIETFWNGRCVKKSLEVEDWDILAEVRSEKVLKGRGSGQFEEAEERKSPERTRMGTV